MIVNFALLPCHHSKATDFTKAIWWLRPMNECWTRHLEWSVEPGNLIAACPNCFTPSYIGWTFHNVSNINSESINRCLQNKAPQYLMDYYCTRTSDVSSRHRLRSANRRQLMVTRHGRSTFGRRAFSVARPMEWNSLPHSLRDPARTTDGFRSALKTHLFAAQRDV